MNQAQKHPHTNHFCSRPSLLGVCAQAWHVRLRLCMQCSNSICVYWQYKQFLIAGLRWERFSCGSVGVWPWVTEIITRSSEAQCSSALFTSLHICDHWCINRRHILILSKAAMHYFLNLNPSLCLRNATQDVVSKDKKLWSLYIYKWNIRHMSTYKR